jgi:hypothetical protein
VREAVALIEFVLGFATCIILVALFLVLVRRYPEDE